MIADAQREIRTRFAGGFYGQLVSGVLWLVSAALATWQPARRDTGVVLLLFAGIGRTLASDRRD